MSAQKLKSGKWRARVYSHTDNEGKKHYKSFTSSSKKEAERMAMVFATTKHRMTGLQHITVGEATDMYIENKRYILSESTIYGYEKIRKVAFDDLFSLYVDRLTKPMLKQAVIDEMNKGISAKTLHNRYGLICSVLKEYAPQVDTNIELPKKVVKIPKLPEPEEVIKAVKGTNVELPVLLAMWLSFSLSEMKGLKKSSIVGDYIQVDQVVVYAGKNVEKDLAKVSSRIRRHRLPLYIRELIDKLPEEQEYLVPEWGTTINYRLKKVLEANNLPIISIHKCRHLFASISLAKLNINSEIVKQEGGWTTDRTMKDVYTHTFDSDRVNADKKIDDYFYGVLDEEKTEYKEFLKKLNLKDNPNSKVLYENYIKLI